MRFFGAILAIGLLGLTGCSAAPEPDELTVTAAGARYLDAVCSVNAAWDTVDVEVDRLRISVARGESGDTRAIETALAALGRETDNAMALLDDESVGWPQSAVSAISRVLNTLEADTEQIAAVAELPGRELADYSWSGAENAAASAAAARTALGLPEEAGLACDEHVSNAE